MLLRAEVAAQRNSDYATLARAKGLRDAGVRWRHVLPNAALPATTLVFTNLGFVMSGAVAVETVFSWPGIGYLTFEALRVPDLPVLRGTFLVMSASVVAASIVADLMLGRWARRLPAG